MATLQTFLPQDLMSIAGAAKFLGRSIASLKRWMITNPPLPTPRTMPWQPTSRKPVPLVGCTHPTRLVRMSEFQIPYGSGIRTTPSLITSQYRVGSSTRYSGGAQTSFSNISSIDYLVVKGTRSLSVALSEFQTHGESGIRTIRTRSFPSNNAHPLSITPRT